MRRIKEVLRLRYELKLDQRQIARSCSLSVSTVHEYLKRAEAANVSWPLPHAWDDARVEAALFHEPESRGKQKKSSPDFAAVHEQLRRHRHVTLQLLWQEYRDTNPDGYRYSRFCELYQRWRKKLDVVMRQEHKAGEKAFIDWAGATIPVHDRATGAVWQAPLFVAALGASSYTWAEATRDQQMGSWLRAHMHAFTYWGGVPALAIPDNTKTGVTKACRYDPDLNPTYHNFAVHYGFGVLPARPYKPRDKAVVESAVQVAQRWIVAALRHHKFFSLEEANQAIRGLLERLNHRPFRKREGSRASVFDSLDKPALKPLPRESFDMSEWSRAKVDIDYHVAFDANLYSVPYNLVHETVEIRATPATVEILHKGVRVASHVRSRSRGQTITNSRAPAQESSSPFGMDAVADAALGTNHRAEHHTTVRADHGRQAASGDGLSCLPGAHPASRKVLAGPHGGRRRTGRADRRVPVSQCRIDSEKLTRSATAAGIWQHYASAPAASR